MLTQEDYEHMAEWWNFQRRHECNLFEALFKDREDVSEEDIVAIVTNVAEFFNMPTPEISSKCETFAEVLLGDNADKCELLYNIEMLKKAGINNRDAFTLCFVHEMAHQMLFHYRFSLFCSERWIQELAADMTAGLYAERHALTTGKFKFALSRQKYSLTHPDGKLRKEIVECGRQNLERMRVDGNTIMDIVVRYMPFFVYTHNDTLESDYRKMAYELEMSSPPSSMSVRIEDLSGKNLLKQAILRHRQQKEKANENK